MVAVACLGIMQAQDSEPDVLTIHFKNGMKQEFPSGARQKTSVFFWGEEDGAQIDGIDVETSFQDEDSDWGVLDWGYNATTKEYGVVIKYEPKGIPMNYRTLLFFGKTPGLSRYQSDNYISRSDMLPMLIRIGNVTDWQVGTDRDYKSFSNFTSVFPLEYGCTYYYRPAIMIEYEHEGEPWLTFYYGKEEHFRIPLLMRDTDILPQCFAADGVTFPAAEAWEQFNALHFEGVQAPSVEQEGAWWQQWLQTDEGKANVPDNVTDHVFDDGTIHLVEQIPEAFYTWLVGCESVINRPHQLEIRLFANDKDEMVPIVTCTEVDNVDPAWGLPGNSYLAIEPTNSSAQSAVTCYPVIIPGQTYKLKLTLAPETRYENTEENATYFLPTKLRISTGSTVLEKEVAVPATETTVVECEFKAKAEYNVQIDTRVSASQMRNGIYNRIFRLSELRLTPVEE